MNPAAINKILNSKSVQMIIKLIIVIIVIVMIWFAYKKISKKIQASKISKKINNDLKEIIDKQSDDVDAHVSGNVRTYNDADYDLMADALYEAMDGPGTDKTAIVRVLNSLRTKADWYALNSAFGSRETSSYFSSFKGNLTKWLVDELDWFDSGTKTQINNILSKFGVGNIF